jgi:hypothetical protein
LADGQAFEIALLADSVTDNVLRRLRALDEGPHT